MNYYQCKTEKLTGSSYDEVLPLARESYRTIANKTKRTPYVKSPFFGKKKVFLNVFWAHMNQKNRRDKARRLAFYPCAIELIRNSMIAPSIHKNPNGKQETVYRFHGKSKSGKPFSVQVKEDKHGSKHFMSVMPE